MPTYAGDNFFSVGRITPTIDSTPKQPRRTLHPAKDLQAHAKYFNFKRRKVQDKDDVTLLYQVCIPPVHFLLNFSINQLLRHVDFLLTIARG